ncbi:MAG TPA: SDR family oxidoreductase [Rhizomicrobium sp.]|nr:SDR family oxidoreductase [Rhizomicrobium sp.]
MSRSGEFAGRVVVVTGAAAGVGRAVAMQFARAGARLGLISRDGTALEALAGEIRAAGGVAVPAAIDVSDAGAVFTTAERFTKELGPLDIWVNDAMLTVFAPVARIAPEEFRRVTDVTYLGVVHGTMAALRQMRGRGRIVNIGSALAYRGIPLQSAYCGAKHAIRGFTAALRTELRHQRSRISVSIVELPAMNTPQFDWARTHMPRQPRPMGTIYQPEAAARAVIRAARTGAREYWVGWPTFVTIVGNMVAPAFMDRYLAGSAIQGQQTGKPVPPDRRDNLVAPVTGLHRTHGSFDSRSKPSATILSGDWARVLVLACGSLAFVLLGAAFALTVRRPASGIARNAAWRVRSVVRSVLGS